jgi:hypothetical protein
MYPVAAARGGLCALLSSETRLSTAERETSGSTRAIPPSKLCGRLAHLAPNPEKRARQECAEREQPPSLLTRLSVLACPSGNQNSAGIRLSACQERVGSEIILREAEMGFAWGAQSGEAEAVWDQGGLNERRRQAGSMSQSKPMLIG